MRLPRTRGADTPTVFHVTHYKAGSQWIHAILRRCARRRIVPPRADRSQFLEAPIEEGKVYPTLYVTRQEFQRAVMPTSWRRFVVIRDLRDTLVSGYFSVKISHPQFQSDAVAKLRERLQTLDTEEGLVLMMDHWLPGSARIQRSWIEAGEPVIRYEELLEHDVGILKRVLIDECHLPVRPQKLRRAVIAARFDNLSGGRPRGEEDRGSHQRKGVAGDWTLHFSRSIKDEFKRRWGDLLMASGYEQDQSW